MENTKKLSLWSLVMLIFIPTFGFSNITSNAVYLGPASIPSWLIVSVFYFLPLSIIIAELSSANQSKSSGLYAWIECAIGPFWAFVGTWSYFICNLFYLQMVFARIPVMASWALFGENRFTNPNTIIILSAILAIILTYIATIGVQNFSKISDLGGKLTLIATVIFVFFAIVGLVICKIPSATPLTYETMIPKFDSSYFSTFSWLLLAVAGSEVAGTYIKEVDNPNKTFPKGVIIATLLIGVSYVLGSLAVCFVASPQVLEAAGIKDANYVVYKILAQNFGLGSGKIVVQLYALIYTISSIAAYVVWIESPLRAMFSEVPDGTFPNFLTKKRNDGTMVNALWVQCSILIILIVVPIIGLGKMDSFFELLTNLSALSVVVPYVVLIGSYFVFKARGNETPFKIFKKRNTSLFISGFVFIIGIVGFIGAGWNEIAEAKSLSDALSSILRNYGGPIILIIAGIIITRITNYLNNKNKENI